MILIDDKSFAESNELIYQREFENQLVLLALVIGIGIC